MTRLATKNRVKRAVARQGKAAGAPKDPGAIEEALELLLDDPGLRERLGSAGIRKAHEYDWTHVTSQLVDLYQEVIQRRRPSV